MAPTSTQIGISLSRIVESSDSRGCSLTLNQSLCLLLPQLVSHTHLAGPVKRGVVDQRDASLTCSVSQTPMGVPVPQAGGDCSAMKVGPTYPGDRASCSWCREGMQLADITK